MEQGTSRQAIHAASSRSRIIGRGSAVAGDDIVASIPRIRRIVDPELRVIENVKGFGPEFEIPLAEHFEMPQEGNIEIRTSWIVERISPAISKRQPPRSDESLGIENQGPKTLRVVSGKWGLRVGIPDTVGIRAGSKIIGYATVVRYTDSTGTPAINHAKGRAGLNHCDSGKLPIAQQMFREGRVSCLIVE